MPYAGLKGLEGTTAVHGGRGPVLIPLDGSPLAEHALPWGAALAARCGLPLLLAQAVHPPSTTAPGPATAELVESLLEAEHEVAVAYVQGLAVRLREATPGLEVRTAVRLGDPASVLLRLEADEDVPLVVMSTHGRSGLNRWFRGSVAEAVLRRGTAPLLLVRPADDPTRASWLGREGGRVLIPLDGSDLAACAVPQAVRVVIPGRGELVLTAVVHPGAHPQDAWPAPGRAPAPALERATAQRHLEEVAVGLRRRGVPATTVVFIAADPAAAIVDLATVEETDLIVMATHGRGGLGRWRYGSVADAVSRAAPSPVLLVRPRAAGRRTSWQGAEGPEGAEDVVALARRPAARATGRV